MKVIFLKVYLGDSNRFARREWEWQSARALCMYACTHPRSVPVSGNGGGKNYRNGQYIPLLTNVLTVCILNWMSGNWTTWFLPAQFQPNSSA